MSLNQNNNKHGNSSRNKIIHHFKTIFYTISDRMKMHTAPHLDPDNGRVSLQNKVQFDIHFFFFRRGMENVDKMQISMFEINYDPDEQLENVVKVEDEATKNHRKTDQNIQICIMPAKPGDRYCPVTSYKMYLSNLHPDNPYPWQAPNLNPKDPNSNIWYTKAHLGKNAPSSFMS